MAAPLSPECATHAISVPSLGHLWASLRPGWALASSGSANSGWVRSDRKRFGVERRQARWQEGIEVEVLRPTADDELAQSLSRAWRIQHAPHGMPGRDIGTCHLRNRANQWHAVGGDRAVARLAREYLSRAQDRHEALRNGAQLLAASGLRSDLGRVERQRCAARQPTNIKRAICSRRDLRRINPAVPILKLGEYCFGRQRCFGPEDDAVTLETIDG